MNWCKQGSLKILEDMKQSKKTLCLITTMYRLCKRTIFLCPCTISDSCILGKWKGEGGEGLSLLKCSTFVSILKFTCTRSSRLVLILTHLR